MPSGLLLNLQANDIVIDSNLLRFSWIEDLSQMEMQSTYRIEMRLFGHQGWVLWWDSGNVKSSNSAQVEYNGPDLLSRSLYDWRVSTSKDGTHWSDWSERQSFFSGTFGNWHAKPIWASNDTDTVFFRYEVSLDISKKIKTARWLVTGRDTAPSRQYVFQIFIDGELVGVGPSRGYDSILPYSSFDVTDVLEKRSNICLSAICFSRGKNADFSSELLVFYDDGTSKTVVTDNKWSVLNAKDIVGMGASYHHFYDAGPENWNLANEPRNWKYSGFNDELWVHSTELPMYREKLIGQLVGPIHFEVRNPVTYFSNLQGEMIYDFGMEHVGLIVVDFDAHVAGKAIIMLSEELDPVSKDVLHKTRTKVDYSETWTYSSGYSKGMNFGYRGFRYCKIKCSSPASLHVHSMQCIYPASPYQAKFDSSDSNINRVWSFCRYSAVATNVDLYQDCPTRERGPYEGDAYIQMLSHFNVEREYSIARHTINYLLHNPTWPIEYGLLVPEIVWHYYLYTGDIDILIENWEIIKTKALSQKQSNGLFITLDSQDTKAMIDWPAVYRDSYEFGNCLTVVECCQYSALRHISKIAEALGHVDEAKLLEASSNDLKNIINNLLVCKSRSLYVDNIHSLHHSLHANMYALRNDIVPIQMKQSVIDFINSKKMNCSPYSAQFLLEALFNNGESKKAFELLVSSEKHSWNHMIDTLGATITTEAWSPDEKPNMSFAHPWSSSPANIIPRCLFGIQPVSPGFAEVIINIRPGNLRWASYSLPTIRGTIDVSFETSGDTLVVTCDIPSNMKARVSNGSSIDLPDKEFLIGPGHHTMMFAI